ncbi:MAG: ankyrin repeat domain-containing protein [Candidatus Berkiellales bacterium]
MLTQQLTEEDFTALCEQDPNFELEKGVPLILVATNLQREDLVQKLLDLGADPNAAIEHALFLARKDALAGNESDLTIINLLIKHPQFNPAIASPPHYANIIHHCDEIITSLMMNDANANEIEKWIDLEIKMSQIYVEITGKEVEPTFAQSALIKRIKLYIKHHNEQCDLRQEPHKKINLPVISDRGWCAGFSAVWGYLKMQGEKEPNEKWFFRTLYKIATTPYHEITQEENLAIDKIIGYVNLLQGSGEARTMFGFDEMQYEINQALGLEVVNKLGMLLHSIEEIKAILREFVMPFPNRYVRLSSADHSTGLFYNDKTHQFTLFDPNAASGNTQMDVVAGTQVKTVHIPEQRDLDLDTLAGLLPAVFKGESHALPLEIIQYGSHDDKNLPNIKKMFTQKRIQFLNQMLSARQDKNLDKTDAKGNTTLSMAVQAEDEAATDLLIKRGADYLNPICLAKLFTRSHRFAKFYLDYLTDEELRNFIFPDNHEFKGHSLLTIAVVRNNGFLVEELLHRGVNVNFAFKNNQTPLLFALSQYNFVIAEKLVTAGAKVTPYLISLFIKAKKWEQVDFLIRHHAAVPDALATPELVIGLVNSNKNKFLPYIINLLKRAKMDMTEVIKLCPIEERQNFVPYLIKAREQSLYVIGVKDEKERRNNEIKRVVMHLLLNPSSRKIATALEITKSNVTESSLVRAYQRAQNYRLSKSQSVEDDLNSIQELWRQRDKSANEIEHLQILLGRISVLKQRYGGDRTKIGTLLHFMSDEINQLLVKLNATLPEKEYVDKYKHYKALHLPEKKRGKSLSRPAKGLSQE